MSSSITMGSNEAPLSQAAVGSTVTVAEVLGDEAFRGKMIAMGIIPGVPVSVVEGGIRRPFLLSVPGGKFMLDWKSSQMITIRRPGAHLKGGMTYGR